MKKEVKSSGKNKALPYIIGGVCLIVLIIVIGASLTGNVVRSGESNSGEDVVCKEVQVPYDYLEEYQETVPYTDRECENQKLSYKVERGECLQRVDRFLYEDEPAKYSCVIYNLDEVGGTFGITIGFKVEGQVLEETQSKYIYAQSSNTFTVSRDATVESCYCQEEVPTKQVCRDVTRYKEVTKTRTVVRYRNEEQCN